MHSRIGPSCLKTNITCEEGKHKKRIYTRLGKYVKKNYKGVLLKGVTKSEIKARKKVEAKAKKAGGKANKKKRKEKMD